MFLIVYKWLNRISEPRPVYKHFRRRYFLVKHQKFDIYLNRMGFSRFNVSKNVFSIIFLGLYCTFKVLMKNAKYSIDDVTKRIGTSDVFYAVAHLRL